MLIIASVAVYIFVRYIYPRRGERQNPPSPTPTLNFQNIPDKIIFPIYNKNLNPFFKDYKPPLDMENLLEFEDRGFVVRNPEETPIYQLHNELLGIIFSTLPSKDFSSIAATSRIFHMIYLEQLPNSCIESQMMNLLSDRAFGYIQDLKFPTTPAKYRTILYFSICKRLGIPDNQFLSVEKKGFIPYFLRRLGPFTFLKIPTLINFDSTPTAPIERCKINRLIHFRFHLENEKQEKFIQELAEQKNGDWKTANPRGFWKEGITLQEWHVYMLLAFLRGELFFQNSKIIGMDQTLASSKHEARPIPLKLVTSS